MFLETLRFGRTNRIALSKGGRFRCRNGSIGLVSSWERHWPTCHPEFSATVSTDCHRVPTSGAGLCQRFPHSQGDRSPLAMEDLVTKVCVFLGEVGSTLPPKMPLWTTQCRAGELTRASFFSGWISLPRTLVGSRGPWRPRGQGWGTCWGRWSSSSLALTARVWSLCPLGLTGVCWMDPGFTET